MRRQKSVLAIVRQTLEFITRRAALPPRPGTMPRRYYAVVAPRNRWHAVITSARLGTGAGCSDVPQFDHQVHQVEHVRQSLQP